MTTDATPDDAGSDPQVSARSVLLVVSGFVGVLVLVWLLFWLTHRTGTQYEVLSVHIHGSILTIAAIAVAADIGFIAYGMLAQAVTDAIVASVLVLEDSVVWLAAFVVSRETELTRLISSESWMGALDDIPDIDVFEVEVLRST
jgi:hypothetical protein